VRTSEPRHDDAAPYLLGALNDLERQAYERHLMGCADCQEEVARLRPGVDVLARDVDPVAPPPSLKAGLMAVVEREAALRRAESAPARAPAWRRPALAAAAAATLAVVGVGGYEIGRNDPVAPRSIAAEVDRSRLAGASGRLIVNRGAPGAVLRLAGLPDLPSRQAYAVWVERDGEVNAVAFVSPTSGGVASAGIDGEIAGADAVHVTRERARGVRAPTEQPVISVPLAGS